MEGVDICGVIEAAETEDEEARGADANGAAVPADGVGGAAREEFKLVDVAAVV